MGTYALDELGWYQFERLCQALLGAECGLAVEAWGGSGDRGRDAYSEQPLRFPDPKAPELGPFLFQAKFIAGAAAAGARPLAPLKGAIKEELARIRRRALRGEWERPRHYALLTNVSLTSKRRSAVQQLIREANLAETVTTLGARELAMLLDRTPRLRLSFPQLLGLRDIQSLLREAVAADVIRRSTQEIRLAEKYAPSFVPTRAYFAALDSLRSHSFLVLTGPPEMGKTTAARMLALARLTEGWEAIECDRPDDLFRMFEPDRPQLFVADDAFGSTEYRPERASDWAQNMERIITSLDHRHWVIWTSRPAPLHEALSRLHFSGDSRHFPKPSEVLVDAAHLTSIEKAQILYRHARSSGLNREGLIFVKSNAERYVRDPRFTPLRVARLVQDDLPEILANEDPQARRRLLGLAAERGMREPTAPMTTSFNALSQEQRRMLIAMLDVPQGQETERNVLAAAERHGAATPGSPVQSTLSALSDHFLRVEGSR